MTRTKTVREKIWERLRPIARPASGFHLNVSEVIPDFEGSELATDRVVDLPVSKKPA